MTTDLEQDHFTLTQLAAKWGISYSTVKRMFAREPGVVKLHGNPPRKGHRRGYTLWRIPREVAERVYNRSQVRG